MLVLQPTDGDAVNIAPEEFGEVLLEPGEVATGAALTAPPCRCEACKRRSRCQTVPARNRALGLSSGGDLVRSLERSARLGPCGCPKLCRSWSGGISVLVDESATAGRSNDLEAPTRSGTVSIMPSSSRSGPACKSRCSTGGAGVPAWSCPTPSSCTLRSSTTGNRGTRRSACSRPSSTRSVTPQPSEIKQADRAKHRAHLS